VYRGIELSDWYAMLNIGYRLPCVGASDYPACRALGDCRTYVRIPAQSSPPGNPRDEFASWLNGLAQGRSFVTTGPLLDLEIDRKKPGDVITRTGKGPYHLLASLSMSGVTATAAAARAQIIANGQVVRELTLAGMESGKSDRLSVSLELEKSSWIAARAFSISPSGLPDAEAHTNPVYLDVDGKAPYDRDSLDRLIARIDQQTTVHRQRSFAEKAKVLDYFQRSRDTLLRIRRSGGLAAGGLPADWLLDQVADTFDPTRRTHSDDELKRFLTPVPGKTPAQALATFETVDGFRMELVAAEPLVTSPVAAAFDADGNLYVAEMRDYPTSPSRDESRWGECASCAILMVTDGSTRAMSLWMSCSGPQVSRPGKEESSSLLRPTSGTLRTPTETSRQTSTAASSGVRHPEPAGDGQQSDVGARPQDLQLGGPQRWAHSPRRSTGRSRGLDQAPGLPV
jgi:hypothetical protein